MTVEARRSFLAAIAGGMCLPAAGGLAQAAAYVPKFDDRPQAMGSDEPGFQRIFDGKSLAGWSGDPTYWRVEDGILVGEVVPATRLRSNTFLVWRGARPGDFELKADCRLSNPGNSGINYRSVLIPDPVTPTNRFSMRGYQCDMDAQHGFTGNCYEEKGRMFLALRGQITHVTGSAPPTILGTLGDGGELLSLAGREWNSFHIIARGNTLIHVINGRVETVVIDDDQAGRRLNGLIAVQVHQGFPKMKVEFRDMRLKLLAEPRQSQRAGGNN